LFLRCFLCNLLKPTKRERERHTHTHTLTHGETDREMSDLEQQKKLGDETENNSDEGGEGRGEEGEKKEVEELLRVLTTVVILPT
jgi:hypothetical protein